MSDFPVKAEDKTNTLAIVLIGLSTTVILWASVVALQAYFKNTQGEISYERDAQGLTSDVRGLDAKQRAALAKMEYADASKGSLKHLPIELAKAAVVQAAAEGTDLIPTLGALNVPTVPAVPGKAADDAALQAPAVPAVAPAEGGIADPTAPNPAAGISPADNPAVEEAPPPGPPKEEAEDTP